MPITDLSFLDEPQTPEQNKSLSFLEEPQIQIQDQQAGAISTPPPTSYFDIIKAKTIWGISNSISQDPVSNFLNVKNVIPKAEIRNIKSGKGEELVPVIYVPDGETGEMVPLKDQGGIVSDLSSGLAESLRPVIGALSAYPGAIGGLSTGPFAAVVSPAGAALTSLAGTTFYDSTMRSLGVEDKRGVLNQLIDVGNEFALDRYGGPIIGKALSFIPEAAVSISKKASSLPGKIVDKTIDIMSKFGLMSDGNRFRISNSAVQFRNGVGEKSAKEIISIMAKNGVEYPQAIEILAQNKDLRGIIESTMKKPFGGTLLGEVEKARMKTGLAAFKLPKSFKDGVPLTKQEVGTKIKSLSEAVFDKRQTRQKNLRSEFDKSYNRIVKDRSSAKSFAKLQEAKSKILVSDLAESLSKIEGGENIFEGTMLKNNSSFMKASDYLRKKKMVEYISSEAGVDQDKFSSAIMNLEMPGEQVKNIINELISVPKKNKGVDIYDLMDMEKAARGAYSDRFTSLGGKVDSVGTNLGRFRDAVSKKLNKEIEKLSPELLAKKKQIDKQWKTDSELIESGFQKLIKNGVTPEKFINIATQEVKEGGTRIESLRRVIKDVDPTAWNEMRVTIIDQMGKGGKGDMFFSLKQWNKDFSSMSKEAKKVLFGDKPDLTNNLDRLSDLAKLADENMLNTNSSGTAQISSYMDFLNKVVTKPLQAASSATGNYLTSRLISSPKFVEILADGIDMGNIKVRTGDLGLKIKKYKTPNFESKSLNKLAGLATKVPALKEDIDNFLSGLSNYIMHKATMDKLDSNSKPVTPLGSDVRSPIIDTSSRTNRTQPEAQMLGVRG